MATRRRSPPESVATSAEPGGRRRASIAICTRESRSQAPAASILFWSSPCISSASSISGETRPDESDAMTSSYCFSSERMEATPSLTLPETVFVGSSCGSCGR